MEAALEVKNLRKHYTGFTLDDVSFTLPGGAIMGFVGENGAGKTTTIKAILNLIRRDGGQASVFGLDSAAEESAVKRQLGVVMDECMFHDTLKATQIDRICARIFDDWDNELFAAYCREFKLPPAKQVKEYSRGMKMKLSIAAALAHHPRLLLLDEATSGLDPVMREEILDVFLDFIKDDRHSIFLSSHITSDLDKIADYITFIQQGKIVFSADKNELLEQRMLVHCGEAAFAALDPALLLRYRKNAFGYEALLNCRVELGGAYKTARPSIEEIMVFYARGEEWGGEKQ
ncbi:MAG: ABC transporter ATP-binding protein [Bacillota bacterium]|nr:ABC transporter ATP-binding protein [Bacillota bacterium]